jgi:serine protease
MLLLTLLFSFVFSELAPLHLNGDVLEGRVIVVLKDDLVETKDEFLSAQRMFGNRIIHTYQNALKGYAVEKISSEEIITIRSNPNVKFVEYDQVMTAYQGGHCSEQTNTPGSWGLTRISQRNMALANLPYAAYSSQGEGVDAYILDTGIYLEHNEFKTANGNGVRAQFAFKVDPSWSNTDRHGHGTHVASTVAGLKFGVAKSAQLFTVKVLSDSGSGSTAGVIAGVDFVKNQYAANKKLVANMSLGGGFSLALNTAVNNAVAGGVTFVVAAGNDNGDAKDYSPASAAGAITIGATAEGPGQVDNRASYSNFGTSVDIFAPGSMIIGAWIGSPSATNTISGTSMASPHVCGIAGLLLADHPHEHFSPGTLKQHILTHASHNKVNLVCTRLLPICNASPTSIVWNGCHN